MSTSRQTVFFKTCLGVFQGGGCRAAALVGAYSVAEQKGVRFAEVAGSSAGSIVAALIGAGADAAYLTRVIRKIDYRNFLVSSVSTRSARRSRNRPSIFPNGMAILAVLRHLGIYSSEYVETWLNDRFAELRPDVRGEMRFRDLALPTYVVATDIRRHQAKVWDSHRTPDDFVAKAVRASCSIPLFFRPVDREYADGGVLSNLPAFVFSHRVDQPITTRVLAFSLHSDAEFDQDLTPMSLLKHLASSVVEGASEIQTQLQADVHVIDIPTSDIRPTDFSRITDEKTTLLLRSGKEAATTFFDMELSKIRERHPPCSICEDQEQMYATMMQNLDSPLTGVAILDNAARWVWDLFPALLWWRTKSVPIFVRLGAGVEKDAEGRKQVRTLRSLGATVDIVERVGSPFTLLRGHDETADIAIVRGDDSEGRAHATRYGGGLHQAVIDLLKEQVPDDAWKCLVGPEIEAIDQRVIVDALGTVPQYRGANVGFRDVSVDDLVSMTKYVREFKLHQAEKMSALFEKAGLSPYEAAWVRYGDGTTSLIGPPVVEQVSESPKYVLVEGSTRAFYRWISRMGPIRCAVVNGVSKALPSSNRVALSAQRVISRKTDATYRYGEFDYDLFRHIERHLRPAGGE